jgi:hypothetical protein
MTVKVAMRSGRRRIRKLAVPAFAICCILTGAALADEPLNPKDALAPIFRENPKLADPQADRARLRNEGIAHYEGGLTLDRAIASFQAAYDIGHQPVDAFNMALVLIKQNKLGEARVWTEKALEGNAGFANAQYTMGLIEKLDGHADAARERWTATNKLHPTDANLHYELAMLASADKDEHTFLQELLRALELDPDHKSSLYQMYRYYQTSGNKEMAAATLKRFNAVKSAERFSRKERPLDESSFTKPLRDDHLHGTDGFPFIDSTISVQVIRTRETCSLVRLARMTVIAAPAREYLVGTCADGTILQVADGKAETLGRLDGPVGDLRVDWLDSQGPRVIAAGPSGVRVSTPIGKSPLAFETIDDTPARRFILADFEHDGSLDILTDAAPAPLARHDGKYSRQPAVYANSALAGVLRGDNPLGVADLQRRGMADLVRADGQDVQFVVDGAAGYRNGSRIHVTDHGTISGIEVADLDNDGVLDVVAASSDGISIVWGAANPDAPVNIARLPIGAVRFVVADMNNDGRRDVVTIDSAGTASVLVNRGPRGFDKKILGTVPVPAGELIAFDENRDGLIDIAYIDGTGALVLLRNDSRNVGASIDVLLNGKRSPPAGQLTQVEVRKGPLFSYAQSAGGLVHFGLGKEEYAEIVRLEWPNGFVENKIKVDAAKYPYVYQESERIAGSCPTVFVRTPDGFQYVTDALITTAIGILEQRGSYFGFGDEEHVVIPPGLLTEAEGRLDIRVTEELRETTYIDHAALLVIDHPAGARLGSTERLAPPAPEKGPYYLARHLIPAAHASFEGRDVTELLAQQDRRYADTVVRTRNPGFAEPSVIELTLADDVDPGSVDAVFATGWFQAFDSTAVIGAFKGESPDFQFPELQEKVDGVWHSVGFIGIPAGQNRTAVLTLQKPLRSRQLRLLSNFSVYWDEIAFSVAGQAAATVTELPLLEATLRFHGFSGIRSKEPETFDYENVRYDMIWSPMRGHFTNYGPVESLIAKKDGKYAVMGGGDEVALSFRAPAAPPAQGFERSFILVLGGHVKDADRYTANSESVEPVPYAAMTVFPGPPGPEDPLAAAMRQREGLDFTLTTVSSGKAPNHD